MSLLTDSLIATLKDSFEKWQRGRLVIDKTKAFLKWYKGGHYPSGLKDFDKIYKYFDGQSLGFVPAKVECKEHPSGECVYYRACDVCVYSKMKKSKERQEKEHAAKKARAEAQRKFEDHKKMMEHVQRY